MSDAANTPAATEATMKRVRIGVVQSDKRDKTRKVVVAYKEKHPKYGKYVNRRTVLQVHDENNESREGDRVAVAECRPISKTKSWKIVEIVERGLASVDVERDVAGTGSEDSSD